MTGRLHERRRRGQGGFTLLEIMLALAILGMLTATLYGTFSRTAKIKRQMEAAQDRIHTARVALMRMTREIEMAYLSENEATYIPERRTMLVGRSGGDSDELRFSWFGRQRLRADGAEADTSLVQYYVEPDPDDRSVMNLMRRETYRLEALDPRSLPGEAYVLCPGIRRIKFEYFDHIKPGWRDDWNTFGADGIDRLPTHVRIRLTVIDERGQEVTYFSSARLQMTEKLGYRPVKS
jgi:general secretion pathway protein J